MGFWVAITRNGCFQFMRGGAAGDGMLLHGLEQRGLRLGRRAIDLVGQNQVRENRPGRKRSVFEPSSVSIIMLPTMSAGIRSGVNWMREYFRCSTRESVRSSVVFPSPGNAFEQHMAARQQTDQYAVDDFLLSDDDLSDFIADAFELGGSELESGIGLHRIILH